MALHTISQEQWNGGTCAFIDVERALDPSYAQRLGVKLSDLVVVQGESGEDCLEMARIMAASGHISLIVIDSVAALVPRSELDAPLGEGQLGAQASMVRRGLDALITACQAGGSTLLLVNQIRDRLGIRYGMPTTTSGGLYLKTRTFMRVSLSAKDVYMEQMEAAGRRVACRVVQNLAAPPLKECEFDIEFGRGISLGGELLSYALEEGHIRRDGIWYHIYGEEEPLGNSKQEAARWIEDHPDIADELVQGLRDGPKELT